jgi:hypothetical protein
MLSAGTVSARGQPAAPNPQASVGDVQLTPPEIEIYRKAPTLIDWTPRQVKDTLPKLRPAENQDQLTMILERAGQTVTALLLNFPSVACDEEVITGSWQRQARVEDTSHHKFRYIVIPHPEDLVPTFEEYRTDVKGNPIDKAKLRHLPLMTYNFVSTVLLLSPSDQRETRFRYFGTQTMRDRECHVVGFAQDPDKAHRVSNFSCLGKKCALLLQGLAWVDSGTFDILRINTWLLAPRLDTGLGAQFSQVEFYPTTVGESEKVLWLPRDVSVTVICRGIPARNTHHYTNFKLFRVESTIKP